MKRKLKIWFPIVSTHEDEIWVEVPNDVDPDDWLYENEAEIIEGHHLCEQEMSTPLDLGYAGSKFIDDEDNPSHEGKE